MADNISLGKNGNTGKIDFSRIKAGVKKEELVKNDARLESVFDMVDSDKDGTLNRTELDELQKLVSDLAGDDGNLDSKEAKNFGEQKLGRKDRKALLEFLNKLDGVTPEDVEKVETKLVDDKQVEVVTFKDGHIEEYYPNGQKISEVVQGNKKTKTTEMNGEVTKEVVTENEGEENEIISTTSIVDGKKQTIINNKGDKTTTTINYNGDKKSDATIVGENSTSVITYDSEGNPAKEVETSGTTEKTYIYQNGQKVLQKSIENKGLEGKETTKVYDSEGGYTQTKEVGNGKITTVVDKDGNVTSNVKTEKVNGQEVSLQLDKDGNIPGVIVQNGESPAAIAKKFGCSVDELMRLNADQLKGKGKNQYFEVGSEIKLPNTVGIEKFTKAQEGRKSAEEAKAEYARDAQIRQQKAAEARERKAQEEATLKELGLIRRENGQVECYYSNKPNNKITLKKIGVAKNGRSICQDKNGNYIVVAHNGIILKTDYIKNPEKYEQARKYNANLKTRKNAENLAQQFYQIADDNSGLNSMKKMQELLDTKINSKNIVAFLDAYDREKTKQGDSSIIDTVTSEVGAGGTKQQRQVLMSIMNKLCVAAKEAGVSVGDIQKAQRDFKASLNKEFNAARRTNPKEMEKAIDFLRGAIASKANGGGQISEKDAIRQFNSTFGAENATAQKDYKDARANEGWTAKVGDTVCGWFGCNTIADMDKKLGANAAAVKKLANSKTEAEFKKNYKAVFGIEFDKNKIAARQIALERYQLASNCNSTIKLTNTILKSSNSYSGLRQSLKANFKYDDAMINQIIDSYAAQTGKTNPTDDEKRKLLVQFLQNTKSEAAQNYRAASQGKTLEQMGKDVDLITRSAFGTSDIVKDVIQFNENQQTTEMVTEAAFEIAGTVALQFVPGLGQAAAARLAVSAARWGSKAVKVVKYAQKAEKAFNTVNKFQKGQAISNATTKTAKVVNKGAQVGMQMAHAGTATMAVDLSDGKSVKEATQKALMNMSFAGVGASSSIIAPKLVQTFGISNKLATEIAEELMNAAGSYGVTTLSGGEYGSTDAFVDFASGLIMSRISHVKSGDVPTPKKPSTLDKATVDGTKAPGGKFSEQNFNNVKKEVASELPSANSERAAQIYKEGDKLQNQSRTQGKEIEHMVQDEVGFVEVDKERIDIATADEATLAKAKKAVESWDSTSRDKAGMLDKINARQAELEAGKVSNPKAPARSTEVVDRINTNVEQSAENILSGKKGALAPHDAATLEDYLVNSLNTKEEIEQFKAQLKERVGADANGNMFKYEVQGKDHAADLMAKADKKLKQLADFDDVMATIPEQGGMGDLTAIKSFVNKPSTTAEQLDALIAKMEANPALKKFGGSKKLIADMKTRSDILKAKNASVKTPKKEVVSDEVPSTPVKVDDKVLGPEVETPVTPQPKYTKEFEPAHNDTPVSSEIIDQRLDANNPELHEMGEYYRDLETREFEPHYEKREVSAKTIDEQFENPELKKLNEEFASGNSMLQKQAAVENAIDNLSYQNYSPEYVESIREKIKEISVGNPEMEKSYNELLDMAANDASTERASLIREKEYIKRTYGTHKSASESAQTFSDHFEQVNAAKEDEYIRRTHQNPSGKSAAESAEVFEKGLAVRNKVKATDEQLHQKTLLDGDELFERITHSDNPELQQLGAQYKKLEAQEQELQQQVERLKEQIRRKAQTSASEIDSRFNRSNPELEIMNTKYRSLELQQERLRAQVEKLKQQMREKVSVSADDIDARLNQRTGDYEDLAADLRNREAVGQRAKKELELEKAEQAAVEREQAYIDRTYNTTHKSASESADVFKADIAKKEAAAKAKEEAKLRKQQQMQVAIYEQAISDIYDSRNLKDLQKIQKRISSISDPVKRAEVQKQLDKATNFFKTNKVATKEYLKNYNEAAVRYENGTYSQYLLKNELENMMKNQAYRKPEDLYIDETIFLNPVYKFLKKHPGIDLSDSTQLSKLSIKEQRELTYALILAKANGKRLKDFDDTFGTALYYNGAYNAVDTIRKNITPDIPVKPQNTIDSFNNDLDNLITDIKAKKDITDVSVSIKEIIENGGFKISDENITKLNDVVNNPKFGNLSAEDKKLVMMATLLQDSKNIASQTDTVFDVYNVASKLGMTRQNADKLLNITKGGSFVTGFMNTNKSEKLVTTVTRGDAVLSQERKNLVTEFAWDLKDGNNYELAKMIYQAGEPNGLTRNIDKLMEKEIQRLREKQLVMPQTSQAEIMAHTQMMTIGGVEVPVVKASDIPGFRTFTHSPGGTTNHQHIDSAIQNLEVFGKLGDEHNVCTCYVGGDNLRFYGLDGYAFMMDVDPNKILTGYVKDLNSSAKTKSQAIAEFFSGAGGINQRTAEFLPELICDGLGISKEEYGKRIHALKQKCGSDFSIENMKKYDKELAEVLENGMLDDNAKWTDKRDKTKELFFNRTYSHNEYDVYNPTIKGIVTTDPPRVDHRALLYAKEHNLPIVILNDAKLDYVKNTVENLNMDNLSSVNIEELKVKINQLEMPFSSIYKRELNDKLTKLNPIITVEQAKYYCSDDKLIALATRKDGSVNKDALDLVVKYKQLADFRDDEVEFLLEQCNGNYKKVNDLMNKIQSELDRLDLEIRHGSIGIKGLKLGEFPDMDNQQFMKKYGSALNRSNKLINGCYRIDDLMHFYLFGKGKYIDSFNSGNIMKDLDIAYGCRSVTDGYHVRYTNIGEKEGEIAELMAHSLSSQPTPDQRYALGCYKGDMSGFIQERSMIKEGNDIEEYLSNNPLKKSINVKREDSYAILSNLKFADGVTLKDALTNPQYYDRLSQIKSLEGQSFINDRFISTTVGSGAFGNCDVNWDLEVSEGVGATYLDILGLASEGELLLNRGLKVTIIEIGDTTPKGVVHIKAKVEKAD